MILTEILPDGGDCMGLHSIFPVSPFRPSGNSVAIVLLIIHTRSNHLGAHLHVQTLVETLNRE